MIQIAISRIHVGAPPTLRQHMLNIKARYTRCRLLGIEIAHLVRVHIQYLVGIGIAVGMEERIP